MDSLAKLHSANLHRFVRGTELGHQLFICHVLGLVIDTGNLSLVQLLLGMGARADKNCPACNPPQKLYAHGRYSLMIQCLNSW